MTTQNEMVRESIERIAWQSSLTEALQQAQDGHKPILVDFSGAPQCQGCVAMESSTYRDPAVERFIVGNFVPMKVNVANRRELVD